ncbi:MAG TPA: nucleoside 2-deoxyribosyltransferase [Candidatus Limnocylindria bacterium]|nr:nucleoside 2-deoxyribosyltransferase [Candidatus Limnocylindria bacterium]
MKLYFAAPLFTAAERDWNAALAGAVRAAGHEVYLAQENEPGKSAPEIFAVDIHGIDWAEGLVAIMDGADPDSGTCWEVGYAYGRGKPVVMIRTDIRNTASDGSAYNAMLSESATIRVDLPAASMAEVAAAVIEALQRVEARR